MKPTATGAAHAAMLAAVLALCTPAVAPAQPLPDPTRPPPMAANAAAKPAGIAAPASPVLQSVLMAREGGGRQVAVIDGETVRLGASFHGAVLVRMTDTEVELRRGNRRQVLKLFPAGTTTVK